MTGDVVMSVAPSDACRRLHHQIEWQEVATGTGDRVEVCVFCSTAHEKALERFGGDEHLADEFVRDLRRDAE